MNLDSIEGKWTAAREKLSSQWSKLKDHEIKAMQGTFKELTAKFEKAYGDEKDKAKKAKKEIKSFLKKHRWCD